MRVQDMEKNGCFLRGELTVLTKMVDYLQDAYTNMGPERWGICRASKVLLERIKTST